MADVSHRDSDGAELYGSNSTVTGTGSPEGVVSANIGALYRRTDGATGTTLYVKERNSGDTTGWVPVGGGGSTSLDSFGAVGDGATDNTAVLQSAIDSISTAGGGVLLIPLGTYNHAGLVAKSNVILRGQGPRSRLHNTATDGTHAIRHTGGVRGGVYGFALEHLRLSGNAASGDGLHLNGYSSPFTLTATTGYANQCGAIRCIIDGHGERGVYLAAGDKALIEDSYIYGNGEAGVYIDGTLVGCNMTSVRDCSIERNGNYGVRVVWIASATAIVNNQINENTTGGVQAYACDTFICDGNGFNANTGPAINCGGIKENGTSIRLVDGGSIQHNIFGDNGTGPMVLVHDSRAVNIDHNTFYKVGEPGESSCIALEGINYGVTVGPGNLYFGATELKAAIADDGGVQVDETTAATSIANNDMTLLPTAPAVNDAYYFGGNEKFSVMHLQMGTAGAGTWTTVWEYWNGSAWAALSSHVIVDSISGFTAAAGWHQIRFRMPVDWATTTVASKLAFYIRARVSAFTSTTTQPKGRNVWILSRPRTLLDVSSLDEGYYTFCDTDADEGTLVYKHPTTTAIPLATQVIGEQFRRWQIRETGEQQFGSGSATFDATLKRAGSGVLSVTKLGVGNASASSPDVTLTTRPKKVEVFDDSGVSQGFLQVYSGTGAPDATVVTALTAALDPANATTKGLVPTPPNNTTTFLRGDATFAAPKQKMYLAFSGNVVTAGTNDRYANPVGYATSPIGSTAFGYTIPVTGTITAVYYRVFTAHTTNTVVLSARVNGVNTQVLSVAATVTTSSATGLSIAVAPNDFLALEVDHTGATNLANLHVFLEIEY